MLDAPLTVWHILTIAQRGKQDERPLPCRTRPASRVACARDVALCRLCALKKRRTLARRFVQSGGRSVPPVDVHAAAAVIAIVIAAPVAVRGLATGLAVVLHAIER